MHFFAFFPPINNPTSYYLDPENFPNQELMSECLSFMKNALSYNENDNNNCLNIQWHIYKGIKQNPSNIDELLHEILAWKISPRDLHTIFGLTLKWFGGYPCGKHMGIFESELNKIEREFLLQLPNERTPEKEFCVVDNKNVDTSIHDGDWVQLKIQSNKVYKGSSFIHRFNIDFEDLPLFVIEGLIFPYFEYGRDLYTHESYTKWRYNLLQNLKTIPKTHRKKAIEKAIEHGTKVLKYHSSRCMREDVCPLEESLIRRITITEEILDEMKPKELDISSEEIPSNVPKEFTTGRQVLAMHYLLKHAGVNDTDKTAQARFIQFLTCKQLGAKNIRNTDIYKRLRSPIAVNEETSTKDLQFIRTYFEELGLTAIVKEINKEIGSKE